MQGISIIICCYNSSARLPQTIRHLAGQECREDINWEVIIVDNASKDNTSLVANEEWQKYKLTIPFKVVYEAIPGLSAARKKGKDLAKFDFLLYCDDDNWLDSNYVERAYNLMSSNVEIGVLGGQTYPVYEVTPPNWFIERGNFFALGKQSDKSGDLTNGKGWVWGAGSIFRKEIFEKIDSIGYKLLLTGRKGKSMTSGEDIELCYIVKIMGYKIWYDEGLFCAHYMPKGRYSIKKFHKLCKANGNNVPIFRLYNSSGKIKRIDLLRQIKQKSLRIFRMRNFFSKHEVTNSSIEYYALIGEVYGILELLFSYNKLFLKLEELRSKYRK